MWRVKNESNVLNLKTIVDSLRNKQNHLTGLQDHLKDFQNHLIGLQNQQTITM